MVILRHVKISRKRRTDMKRDANGNRQQEYAGESVACAMANCLDLMVEKQRNDKWWGAPVTTEQNNTTKVRYRVAWRSDFTGASGYGLFLSEAECRRAAKQADLYYPGIHHFVESVLVRDEPAVDTFEPPQEGLLLHLKPENMEEATATWKDGRAYAGLMAGPGGPPDIAEPSLKELEHAVTNKEKLFKILKHLSCLMGDKEFEFHKDGMARVIDGILNE